MTESRRSPLALLLLSTLLSTLLTPLAACAASGTPAQEQVLVELSELRAAGDASFARLDGDGDGMITEAEFTSAEHGTMASGNAPFVFMHRGDGDEIEIEVTDASGAHADMDMDMEFEIAGDESVHAFAFATATATARDDASVFADMDTDGDGMLSLAEYEARAHHRQRIHREIVIDAEGEAAGAFAGFDANDDGVITRDEWPSPETHLAEMDLDGDGRLTLSEMGGDGDQRVIRQRRIIRTQ